MSHTLVAKAGAVSQQVLKRNGVFLGPLVRSVGKKGAILSVMVLLRFREGLQHGDRRQGLGYACNIDWNIGRHFAAGRVGAGPGLAVLEDLEPDYRDITDHFVSKLAVDVPENLLTETHPLASQ